jgi:hypothetical protein
MYAWTRMISIGFSLPVFWGTKAGRSHGESVLNTKGILFQIGYVDRFSRETLEERLEETPSNARCFAQGSSLMC